MTLAAPLVPFAQKILDLDAARREVKSMEWSKVAGSLDSLAKEIGEARRTLERESGSKDKVKREAANRALASVDDLRNTLRGWYSFYDGYDPLFTWWMQEPYKGVDEGLQSYADFLRQRLGAVTTGLGEGFGGGRRGGGGGGGGGRRRCRRRRLRGGAGGGAGSGAPAAGGGTRRRSGCERRGASERPSRRTPDAGCGPNPRAQAARSSATRSAARRS